MSEEPSVIKSSTHVIPLKKVYYGRRRIRAKRAIRLIREYVMRHFRKDKIVAVKIDDAVNKAVWSRGIEKPPRRIKVLVEIVKEEIDGEEKNVAVVKLPEKK